jgi:hypothetical protein
LICVGITLAALSAHAFELPNKLSLDGPLWLAVQQNLYRGWGPFVAPFELAGLASTWLLAVLVRRDSAMLLSALAAALCLSLALIVFFALNAPVNAAFAGWTPETLPPDWAGFRIRWEIGHAIRFVLVLASFVMLVAINRRAARHWMLRPVSV